MTNEMRMEPPSEPNVRLEAKVRSKLAALLCYIDNGFSITKVNFENSFGFQVNGIFFQVKHAVQAQNLFRHLVCRATAIGMLVNKKKPQ